MHGFPLVLAVALLVTGASGCTLLDLLLGAPPFDPDVSFPPLSTAGATFTTGRATIEMNGETVVLDELTGNAAIEPDAGVHVAWENEDGWYLTFYAYPDEPFSSGGYLSIDRIADHEHWVLADPSRCVTTTEQAGASGVIGTATCRGLRWADFFSAYSGEGFPEPIPSQAPFDAEITFEAH